LFYSHLNPKAMRLNMVYLPKGLLWDLELILFTSQSKGHEVDVAYAHSAFGLNSHFGLVVLTILDYINEELIAN
jgi:hypothetical protein